MDDKLGNIINDMVNNLNISGHRRQRQRHHHHHHHHFHANIPPVNSGYPGSPGGSRYPGNYGGYYPGSPGRSHSRSPSPPRFHHRPPYTSGYDSGRRYSGGPYGSVNHHGPGPHGPGLCPPQCYGWHPPAHCVGNYSWHEARSGSIPHNAVKVGVDRNGGAIFAGRAYYEGDLIPAKVIPSHGCAYVPWGGKEHKRHEYEVLCSVHVGWTTCSGGDLPPEAICVGETESGERLYMGRVMHEGTLTPGKIQPSHGVLYIPYDGLEISYTDYEAMVLM